MLRQNQFKYTCVTPELVEGAKRALNKASTEPVLSISTMLDIYSVEGLSLTNFIQRVSSK